MGWDTGLERRREDGACLDEMLGFFASLFSLDLGFVGVVASWGLGLLCRYRHGAFRLRLLFVWYGGAFIFVVYVRGGQFQSCDLVKAVVQGQKATVVLGHVDVFQRLKTKTSQEGIGVFQADLAGFVKGLGVVGFAQVKGGGAAATVWEPQERGVFAARDYFLLSAHGRSV